MDFPNGTASFPMYIWPLGIGFLIGGAIGVFGNAMIMLAIMRTKELKRNRCNILVGNLALSDLISSIFTIFSGASAALSPFISPSMSNELCYYLLSPTIVSYSTSAMLVLAIGVDRFVSLRWPVTYKVLTSRYTVFTLSFCWSFGLVVAVLGFVYTDSNETVPACAVPTALRSVGLSFWNYSNIVINFLVITIYASTYRRAKKLAKSTSIRDSPLRNNRLLTSLVICVSIYIIGWVLTMMVIFFVNIINAPASVIFHCSMYVGLLADVNVGSDFFVYYVRSDEYRKAFRTILRWKVEPNGWVGDSGCPNRSHSHSSRSPTGRRIRNMSMRLVEC